MKYGDADDDETAIPAWTRGASGSIAREEPWCQQHEAAISNAADIEKRV